MSCMIAFVFLFVSGTCLFARSCLVLPVRYGRDPGESFEKGDKFAILMAHFGSAYLDTRTQVFDVDIYLKPLD